MGESGHGSEVYEECEVRGESEGDEGDGEVRVVSFISHVLTSFSDWITLFNINNIVNRSTRAASIAEKSPGVVTCR